LGIPLGLLLSAYGTLVLVGVIAHESTLAGSLALAAGLCLLIPALRGQPRAPEAPARNGRPRLVALTGAICAGGVVAYNLVRRSSLSGPEWCILGYGLALVVAAPHLRRRIGPLDVATA